ncbi:thiolase family protein [Aquincola sp. S2]|uniref:Thiolase family protein n=1 Tax=Pseudaquabacterium terrae TaxID=2732868 RepID=A0ABX2ETN6_9BURK|nr:thiolase family protein [Aquabacterium terrae]NRF72013.1 thiolase family protein [Aquabacterium terrae]
MSNSSRQATIVGVYQTTQARRLPGRTSQDLVIEAVKGAIADAGLQPRDVDGAAVDWPGPGGAPRDAENWAMYLKQPLSWCVSHHLLTAGVRGVLEAAAAVEAGLCDVAVVGSGRAGPFSTDGAAPGANMSMEFAEPYGSSVMAQFALVATRHMHEFGTTPEQLAHVAATIRNHGHVNPEAVMFGAGPYTAADVLASPLVATPFHRLDCCLMNEGGAAIVITTAERARDLPRQPVPILGGGMEFFQGNYANPPLYKDLRHLGRDAAARAFAKAGVTAQDIDVFSLYDPVSFEVLRQFEMLGLCAEGEGGAFCAGDRLTLHGSCPTNLDGGMLAGSWTGTAQLTLKVIEAVRQLRRVNGARQVPDAELALASNAGSGAQHVELIMLGRG